MNPDLAAEIGAYVKVVAARVLMRVANSVLESVDDDIVLDPLKLADRLANSARAIEAELYQTPEIATAGQAARRTESENG